MAAFAVNFKDFRGIHLNPALIQVILEIARMVTDKFYIDHYLPADQKKSVFKSLWLAYFMKLFFIISVSKEEAICQAKFTISSYFILIDFFLLL